MKKRILLWFNRDLRIANNKLLDDLNVSDAKLADAFVLAMTIKRERSKLKYLKPNI